MSRQADDDKAKQRFMMITAMRFAGAVMVMMGIAILNGFFGLPAFAGYLLIGLGLVETFITPQILARMWSTKAQNAKNTQEREHDGRR